MIMIHKKAFQNSDRNLFNDIDMSLLFGIKCSSGNQTQQNYFEKLKVKLKLLLLIKNFKQVKLLAT